MYRQSIIWTASMVDFLIDHYKEMSNTVFSRTFGYFSKLSTSETT